MTFAIRDEDVAAYRRDGAVLLKGVLADEDLRLLEAGLETAHAEPSGMSSRVRAPEGEGETVVEQTPSRRSPALRALLERGRVAEIAGRMLQAPTAQLVFDQIFYKARGRVLATPWHQDTPFLSVRGHDMLRVWLTCDPSPRALTVQTVRGSHRWNVVYDARGDAPSEVGLAEEGSEFSYAGAGDPTLPPLPDVERWRDSFDILSWDVEPGDALVFQGNVLHGAQGVDDHPRPRRAYASMWGGPDLRYHVPVGTVVPSMGDTSGRTVPHGARIGDFEDVFPVGWRAP
jgi:ectoine hydroxylase-related dioxygenase (phytanoyl-CoA dioxygenase family)